MSQFFETVKYHKGEFFLLDYHTERLNRTRFEKLGLKAPIRLENYFKDIPEDDGLYRCRIDYSEKVVKVEFHLYSAASHRLVALKECGDYEYNYKNADRSFMLSSLKETEADDVIFLKDRLLTDATYSNLAFFDGKKWHTPSSFLLNGVKRQYLINQGFLMVKEISLSTLGNYKKLAFINAMRDFEMVYHFELKNNEIHLKLEE